MSRQRQKHPDVVQRGKELKILRLSSAKLHLLHKSRWRQLVDGRYEPGIGDLMIAWTYYRKYGFWREGKS